MDIDYKTILETAGSERKAAASLGISRIAFLNRMYKALNLCIQCKTVEPKQDCTRCSECLVKAKGNKTKEEKAIYNQAYWEKNSAKLKENNKAYQKNNLDKFAKARKKYESTEAGQISAERRRTKRLQFEDEGMPIFDLMLLKSQIKACENCGAVDGLSLDHHQPLSKGGKLDLANTNILCGFCNSSKRNKNPADYFSADLLPIITAKFTTFEEYKSVQSPKEFEIDFAPKKAHVRNYLQHKHYLKSCPGIIYAMTLTYKGRVLGAAVFSVMSRQTITIPDVDVEAVLELSRFFLLDGTPKNTGSYFLSKCLNWLQINTTFKAVVTFADSTEGHSGGLYRAANFTFLGVTKPNYHYEDINGERIHKRQVWDRSRIHERSEKDQASVEELIKVDELIKYKFAYHLR